ncbi:hypothetical protein J2125_001139 [Erwinia toletana]|uniref:Uncharacterized protein n=1 Tax=Winslowiella toletana TaxID=92490 RepID=A0ABS4P716_9GAMM|nr:hypothetical protein [Winslowiella toletana]MBP2167947.1 hypothetical protein [Winslowiella toletana]
MKRKDYSENVYHWIKTDIPGYKNDEAYEAAFEVLLSILRDGFIKGSKKFITGGEACICFTESPEYFLNDDRSDYKPFGLSYLKEDIFIFGGMPVIYQPQEELQYLDESRWWRHVQFDPWCSIVTGKIVDFSWEREWRIKSKELSVFDSVAIIVPNEEYLFRLKYHLDEMINNSAYENYIGYEIFTPSYPFNKYSNDFLSKISLIKK